MPVPYFYDRRDVSLAINVATGETNLVNAVSDTLAVLPEPAIDAIGIVLDADERRLATDRHASLREKLLELELMPGDAPGAIGDVAPRCGIYVLPDNKSPGTLESILLECAAINYPVALNEANGVIARVNAADYRDDDLRELNKHAGKNKAAIAMITAILKPGKTTQTSISDNRWFHGAAAGLERMSRFEEFLVDLLTGQPERSSFEPSAMHAAAEASVAGSSSTEILPRAIEVPDQDT